MKHWSKLLILPVSLLSLSSVRAEDCVSQCMSQLGCYSGGMGNQNCGYNNSHGMEMCNIQCRGRSAAPAYGAIAFSLKEKVSGWSYDLPDQGTAERTAVQYCVKQGGAKCTVAASFHNTCGAIAADAATVFWGTSGTKYNAEQRALAECSQAGRKCSLEASICSSPGAGGDSSLPSRPPAPKAVSWGAIAYSSGDMGAGWSQGKGDRVSAEKEALALCAQRGRACTVRSTFNKQCGALAADREITGSASAADQRAAQQQALDECRKAGGSRCVLHISFCSQ